LLVSIVVVPPAVEWGMKLLQWHMKQVLPGFVIRVEFWKFAGAKERRDILRND
jgi:hypothetical protein